MIEFAGEAVLAEALDKIADCHLMETKRAEVRHLILDFAYSLASILLQKKW